MAGGMLLEAGYVDADWISSQIEIGFDLLEDSRRGKGAVMEGGMSRNAAAKRFGVSIASAVRWVARFKAKGEISPSPTGGDRRSGRIEAHRAYLLGLIRPAIYFGSTKMNNNFDLVDAVVKQAGGTATIFVKNGDEYVRVATNVKKDDGSRAVGTILDPKGKAIVSIWKNEAFYGDVDILGKPYTTGYDPIRDPENNVIGIYYVGYQK